MAFFAVKMVAGSPPPVTESIGSNPIRPAATSVKRSNLPLQVRVKEVQKLETPENKSINVSRRDLALFLTAASFSAVTLSNPKPAEARISKTEMKKMILEKLKILREKFGLSKPEPDENENISQSPSSSSSSSSSPPEADNKISPSAPSAEEEKTVIPTEPPLPSIQNDKKTVVEAAPLP